MKGYYLYEQIGDPINMITPAEYGTDLLSCNANAGVPVRDAEGILFILSTGDLTTDSLTVILEYSSTGTSSDGGATTSVWAASDAEWGALDSDEENEIHMLDIKIGLKVNTNDADGKFFASFNNTGGSGVSLIGIPYHLNRTPAANANTVVVPDYAEVS